MGGGTTAEVVGDFVDAVDLFTSLAFHKVRKWLGIWTGTTRMRICISRARAKASRHRS